MSKEIGEEIMHKKSLVAGLFLLVAVFAMVVLALNAQATVTVDAVEKTITLTTDSYTLDSIWADANVGNANLTNVTDGTWMANYSIIITTGATLELGPTAGSTGCTWLKLNTKNESGKFNANIQVKDGNLWVNDTMITAWNHTGGLADGHNNTWWAAFRPYIYIYASSATPRAYFLNSTIGYLGFDMDNKYGIVYEDAEAGEPWGWMHNCTVMENYIGINFQGCENMYVTNTWMNNTKEAGIVYTISGTGGGSHGGFIGDHLTWTHRALYAGVAVDYCSGDATAMGIRLCNSDNISFNNVNIQDAYTDGLWIEVCNNFTANYTISYLNTNAADDYNIYLYNCTNSTFTNCTAYTPSGAVNGGNWMLAGGGGNNSHHNNFTECRGFDGDATASYNFHIWHSDGNLFRNCYANHSAYGYYVEHGHNNSFIECEGRTHTYYNFKLFGTQHNEITGGYANISALGILIADDTDVHISHHNEILGVDVNLATGYAVSIGTDDSTDNICHNNTVTNVIVTGTTTGDGIFLLDNVTYNNISGCAVSGLTLVTSGGLGAADWAIHNTFHNCYSILNGGIGFYLIENSSYTTVTHCTANNNLYGIWMKDYTNNNTVNHSDFNNHTWIGIWVSADSASNGGNEVWSTICHDNFYGIYLENTPQVRFTEVNAYDNSCYGVLVDSASAYFFNCIVDNPTVAQYDWYVGDTSEVDIYSPYILGFDKNINYQYDTTQPYGVANHDPGDGVWELNTTQMTVSCQEANTTYVNLTLRTSTKIQWTATSTSGTKLYQKIGGLVPGIRYDLKVNGHIQSTNHSVSGTMLETHGTTGYVWFNYTGSWSTLSFEVKRHVAADGGAAPQDEPEPELDTDGDGWTDAEEIAAGSDPYDASSTPLTIAAAVTFLGLDWYWWVAIIIIFIFFVIALYFAMYPKAWKKFKKSMGF